MFCSCDTKSLKPITACVKNEWVKPIGASGTMEKPWRICINLREQT